MRTALVSHFFIFLSTLYVSVIPNKWLVSFNSSLLPFNEKKQMDQGCMTLERKLPNGKRYIIPNKSVAFFPISSGV